MLKGGLSVAMLNISNGA